MKKRLLPIFGALVLTACHPENAAEKAIYPAMEEVFQRAEDAGKDEYGHYRFGPYVLYMGESSKPSVSVLTENGKLLDVLECESHFFSSQESCQFLEAGPWEHELLGKLLSEAAHLRANGGLTPNERKEANLQAARAAVEKR